MTPEEKFNFEIWWVLQELQHKKISTPKNGGINFVIKIRPPVRPTDKPGVEAQQNAVLKLEAWKTLKIIDQEIQDDTYGKDVIYSLEILQPKFNEIYALYKNGLEQGIEAEKLLEMVKEWARPIKGDTNLSFGIWQLTKDKRIVSPLTTTPKEEVIYSAENLKRISRVLEIILDELELGGVNRLLGAAKIPLGRFRKEGFEIDDISRILYSIDKDRKAAWVIDVRSQWLNEPMIDDFFADEFIKKYGFKITKEESNSFLVLGIKNIFKLKEIKEEIDKKIEPDQEVRMPPPKLLPGLPEINYNINTGVGFVDGQRFKFKNNQPEFSVFAEMYNKIDTPISRKRVLELSDRKETDTGGSEILTKNVKRKGAEYTSDTYFINELVKKMRKRTGLSKDHLTNNNGELTLVGQLAPK